MRSKHVRREKLKRLLLRQVLNRRSWSNKSVRRRRLKRSVSVLRPRMLLASNKPFSKSKTGKSLKGFKERLRLGPVPSFRPPPRLLLHKTPKPQWNKKIPLTVKNNHNLKLKKKLNKTTTLLKSKRQKLPSLLLLLLRQREVNLMG